MNAKKWHNDFLIDLEQKTNSESTLRNYGNCVYKFLNYFTYYREPKEIPTQEIKRYLLKFETHNTRKQHLCAIRKFYDYTVNMPKKVTKIPYPKKQKKLPKVIDANYVNEVINGIENLKHKTMIAVAFECALRRSEILNLKLSHIDRKRKLLLIENSKGNKDRYVPISDDLINLIIKYYRAYKPEVYLFNGNSKTDLRYSSSSYNNKIKDFFGKEFSTHTMRHSGTTAMHEAGVDISTLSKLLGHNSIKTTEIYTHVSLKTLQNIKSPLRLKSA